MKRILFVDDEPRVLDGLRDLFRKQRKEWDMVFAPGGPEGVAALDSGPFDVIVTDMRMPVMDGIAMLHAARTTQPAAVRVVLSGHVGREAESAALSVAHQFVAKPCEPGALKALIGRACALSDLVRDDDLRRTVGELDSLPSAPRLYFDLSRATGDPNITAAALADIVERDTAMAAKVLQLANSAAFGMAATHTSVQQAIVYLGVQRLKALVLSAQVFSDRAVPTAAIDLAVEQAHALRTATLAQRFVGTQTKELAFTAGLLHDVGRLVLATCRPSAFASAAKIVGESGRADVDVESEVLGVTHATAGAYLLALWGLPLAIVEAVQHHETPEANATEVVVAVHVADALVHDPSGSRLHRSFLEESPFSARVPDWLDLAAA